MSKHHKLIMSVEMAEVRAELDPDEPNYARAALLGEGALPHLGWLVVNALPLLASKATHLAGLIGGAAALPILEEASRSGEPVVRAAAAAVLGQADGIDVQPLLGELLGDADVSVRKLSLEAAVQRGLVGMRQRVAEVAASDPELQLRTHAQELLTRLEAGN